ncbi:LLM class flavin-dependent oxidoreductase [Candidatus Thorarchaeota archaeon]|nr:MAG: LLM class flavin-dependent oxidoreductase [Candidatus Thorarchaeota archaeon]
MRFGIEIGSQNMKDIVRIAKAAEDAGFNTVWIADHVPAAQWRDPFVSMTAIGLNTDYIRLGCGVANPYSRHIGITAVMYASMVELLGERFVLGIGAGGTLPLKPLEIEMWNKPVTALRESIKILRKFFKGEKVDYEGKVVSLRNTQLFDKYDIPIYIGTRGPTLSKLAGEYADGIILNPPIAALSKYLDKVQEGMKKSGRSDFEVVEFLPVGISEDGNYESVKPTVALLIPTTPNWALEMMDAMAPAEKIREMLNIDRSKAPELVPDRLVTDFAIAGDVKSCQEQIEAIESEVDELVALSPKRASDCLDMIKTFEKEIIPSFG